MCALYLGRFTSGLTILLPSARGPGILRFKVVVEFVSKITIWSSWTESFDGVSFSRNFTLSFDGEVTGKLVVVVGAVPHDG